MVDHDEDTPAGASGERPPADGSTTMGQWPSDEELARLEDEDARSGPPSRFDPQVRRRRRTAAFSFGRVPASTVLTPVILMGFVALGFYLFKSGALLPPLPPPNPAAQGPARAGGAHGAGTGATEGIDAPPVHEVGVVHFIPPPLAGKPPTRAQHQPQATVTVTITEDTIEVNGEAVVRLVEGGLGPQEIGDSNLIPSLLTRLTAIAQSVPVEGTTFHGRVKVVAKRETDYGVLNAVAQTAARAGFADLSFVALWPKAPVPAPILMLAPTSEGEERP